MLRAMDGSQSAFRRRHACHYSAAGFMHRKRLMIDKRASVQETVQSRQDVARASTLRDRSSEHYERTN